MADVGFDRPDIERLLPFTKDCAQSADLDRVAEGFVGREGFSFELGGLWLSSALAGTGLLICGLSLIGLPLP